MVRPRPVNEHDTPSPPVTRHTIKSVVYNLSQQWSVISNIHFESHRVSRRKAVPRCVYWAGGGCATGVIRNKVMAGSVHTCQRDSNYTNTRSTDTTPTLIAQLLFQRARGYRRRTRRQPARHCFISQVSCPPAPGARVAAQCSRRAVKATATMPSLQQTAPLANSTGQASAKKQPYTAR